jgi:hypothetical protein
VKRLKASEFAELRRVFAGYLHEDFLEEHGTAAAAVHAFLQDANTVERQRFSTEARRFLDRTAALDFADVRALLARLGCKWTPPSREALTAALADAIDPRGDDAQRGS